MPVPKKIDQKQANFLNRRKFGLEWPDCFRRGSLIEHAYLLIIWRRWDRRIVVRSIFRRHRRSHAWRMHKLSYLIGFIRVAIKKLFYIKGAVSGRFDYWTGTVALFG
jgi:hypothetical protein